MIKHLTAILFTVASTLALPPTLAIADDRVALSCDGDVPEEWRRPGGYCDQSTGTGTLAPTGTGSEPTCIVVPISWEGLEDIGDKLLVAGAEVDPCCILARFDGPELKEGERMIVAVACCVGALTDELDMELGSVVLVAC